MKLDRKDILAALETISIAGEGKNMVESGVVVIAREEVYGIMFLQKLMIIKKFRIGPRINISEYLWLDLFSQCFFIKCILQAVLWIRLGWCFCK